MCCSASFRATNRAEAIARLIEDRSVHSHLRSLSNGAQRPEPEGERGAAGGAVGSRTSRVVHLSCSSIPSPGHDCGGNWHHSSAVPENRWTTAISSRRSTRRRTAIGSNSTKSSKTRTQKLVHCCSDTREAPMFRARSLSPRGPRLLARSLPGARPLRPPIGRGSGPHGRARQRSTFRLLPERGCRARSDY